MVSGAFTVLRSWGAGKHACPKFFHVKDDFLYLNISLLLQEGFVTHLQGRSQCTLVSSVSFTKKMNSEGFLHLLLL